MKRKSFHVVKVNLTTPTGGYMSLPAKNIQHGCIILGSYLAQGYKGHVALNGKKVKEG